MKNDISSIWVLFTGLVVGNYLWQYFDEGIYKIATERSFFQSVPIIIITFYIIGKRK